MSGESRWETVDEEPNLEAPRHSSVTFPDSSLAPPPPEPAAEPPAQLRRRAPPVVHAAPPTHQSSVNRRRSARVGVPPPARSSVRDNGFGRAERLVMIVTFAIVTVMLVYGTVFRDTRPAVVTTEPAPAEVEVEVEAEVPALALVRHGEGGANLTLEATDFSRAELLDRVRLPHSWGMLMLEAAVEQHMTQDGAACACAPMFGLTRRHIAFDTGRRVVHTYNPARKEWAAAVSASVENQSDLFPNATTADVTVQRADAVRLAFVLRNGTRGVVDLQNRPVAHCVQRCLDLLDGISVYERAQLQIQ